MSIKFPVLLTFLCLLACHSHKAALLRSSNFLNENILLLNKILRTKASCDKMNVTNIFADHKLDATSSQEKAHVASHSTSLNLKDDEVELLCKAATVAREGQSCYRQLEGIFINLHQLVTRASKDFKAPCPVAAGNTTSLKDFLLDLNRVLQRLAKDYRI